MRLDSVGAAACCPGLSNKLRVLLFCFLNHIVQFFFTSGVQHRGHLFPHFTFEIWFVNFESIISLFSNAASNNTSLSRLSKFLLLFRLFSDLLDILLLLKFVQVLFLLTDEQYGGVFFTQRNYRRLVIWFLLKSITNRRLKVN